MQADEVISMIIQTLDLNYTLHVDDKVFVLKNVSISKSTIPVRKPTTRGGVYFTDTSAYKIKASTNDLSIIKLLPQLMLGPNSEFKPVKIKTSMGKEKNITLVSHLSNTVNTKDSVDLNLIIDKVEA